jgi:alpha-beta hydrolase superfamily lysophospholipase
MNVSATAARTQHKTVEVDGLDIFYREGGDRANPAVLLLHGFRQLVPGQA